MNNYNTHTHSHTNKDFFRHQDVSYILVSKFAQNDLQKNKFQLASTVLYSLLVYLLARLAIQFMDTHHEPVIFFQKL